MNDRIEYRTFGSFKLENRTITGRVITYNELAPSFNERVGVGAFRLGSKNIVLNVRHDKFLVVSWTDNNSLTFESAAAGIDCRSELPKIPAADLAIQQITENKLTGLSVEMIVVKDHIDDEGTRIIDQAELLGVGIVDVPAYPSSQFELRNKQASKRIVKPRASTLWL